MEKLETKVKNLTYITVLGFVVVVILLIGLYFKGNTTKATTTNSATTTTEEEDYDKISKQFESVTVDDAMDLYNKKGTYILYIGRSDCSVCQMIAPVLKEVQEDLDYKTYYYDLNTSSNFRTELKDLAAKFTVKATANGEEDTIGNLFIGSGYTPTIVVIKDGKTVDGFIGYRNKDTMEEMFEQYLK